MPGRPVKRIDAQAAIVGEGRKTRQIGRFARLQVGIVGKRVADLIRLGKPEFLGADAGDAKRLDREPQSRAACQDCGSR